MVRNNEAPRSVCYAVFHEGPVCVERDIGWAFRTPPPIACPMALMNSLWLATFWVSGRQRFFASSFLHAEKTTAKRADGHAAPTIGLCGSL